MYWLILIAAGTLQPLHVGTFPDKAACIAAAEDSVAVPTDGEHSVGRGARWFVCVRSGDMGVSGNRLERPLPD